MKISIVKEDAVVGVDGVFRSVDVSDLDATVHAIQFDSVAGKGRIWFKAETDKGQADLTIISLYQVYIDRWMAAEPLPAPAPRVLTTAEKFTALATAYGLTPEELKAELAKA